MHLKIEKSLVIFNILFPVSHFPIYDVVHYNNLCKGWQSGGSWQKCGNLLLRRFRFSLCVIFFVPFVNVFCHILHNFFTRFLFAFRTVYMCYPFMFISVSLSFMFCWSPESDFQHLLSRQFVFYFSYFALFS